MKNRRPMRVKINTELIFEYIKANRLTKTKFCRQCGIGISTFNRIISGENCKLISLFRMAKLMNVPMHLLFK